MKSKPTIMLAIVAVAAFSVVADAAIVKWSSSVFDNVGPLERVMGTNQFDTAGTLVLADNCGGSATNYDGIAYTGGTINMGGSYGAYHADNYVSDYGTYKSSGGAQTVTLGSGGVGTIVSGNTYRVQLLIMDGRVAQNGMTVEVDGENQGVYANGVAGSTYGDGLLVTGTFTADSDSQTFDIEVFKVDTTSGGGQLNALLLYEIDPDSLIAWSSSPFVNTGPLERVMGTNQFDTAGTLILADNCGGSATNYDGIAYTDGTIDMGSSYDHFHANDSVSDDGTYNSSRGAKTVTLGAGGVGTIAPGLTYRIQLLFMDGRYVLNGQTVAVDGVNQGQYANGVSNVTYGAGLLVTGTFTAESDSKKFAIEVFKADTSSGGGQLNALLLTQIGWTYDQWAADFSLVGGAAADDDADGLSNLHEFGLGGDPTNALDRGYSTSTALDGTWLNYVYPKRADAHSGLIYYLETTDDLILGTWTNSGYAELGTAGTGDPAFNAVTNQVSTTNDQQFIRLIIEEE